MATQINVGNKIITRPGIYALIESGENFPPNELPYGNLCIIDTGKGKGWLGGAGIGSTGKSVYPITQLQQYLDFTKGGELYDLGEFLFKPSSDQSIAGVSKVYIIKAAETTAGTASLTLGGQQVKITTKDQGSGVNAVRDGGNLIQGFALKVAPGENNPNAAQVWLIHGTYKGYDELNNRPYGKEKDQSVPYTVMRSPEFTKVEDFVKWANSSSTFLAIFERVGSVNPAAIISSELNKTVDFAGGTESYNENSLKRALEVSETLDNSFFLALESGVGEDGKGSGEENVTIFNFIQSESKHDKFMFVGGGRDSSQFSAASSVGGIDNSENLAKFYNSRQVVVVHGGFVNLAKNVRVEKTSLHKAAMVVGRVCGISPENPLTFKNLRIDEELHELSDKELEYSLQVGLLSTYYDSDLEKNVVLQGINTLQDNENVIAEDDKSSFLISLERIKSQLNRRIVISSKKTFFSREEGVNRGNLTPEDLKTWLHGYLQTQIGSLILSFSNIQVTTNQDNYFVTYDFMPNLEVSKIVIQGTLYLS